MQIYLKGMEFTAPSAFSVIFSIKNYHFEAKKNVRFTSNIYSQHTVWACHIYVQPSRMKCTTETFVIIFSVS